MNRDQARTALARVAAHAGPELLSKPPHWGDAIQCDGLLYASRALRDPGPAESAARWFEPKLPAGPRTQGWFWFWSAEALPALDLHRETGGREYLDYARRIVESVESKAARTPDGAVVPHPPALEVWVDVAYFTAPATALLGRIDHDPARVERALDVLLVHLRNLIDEKTGLLWHVAYVDKKSHSPCLWARGNSWFSIAASQILGEPNLHDRADAKVQTISDALARQLNAIVALQDSSGLWHTVIDRTDSYLESSACAGFALAIGRALRMNLPGLDVAPARDSYQRALAAIGSKIDANGAFVGVSQQTPPGDFDFYNSVEIGSAPFGTGVCMMALAEALQTI